MKCVVVSHACVARRFREKIAILSEGDAAGRSRLDITLVVPSYSFEGSRKVYVEREAGENYRTVTARTLFTDHIFITYYLDIVDILRAEQPDVVYVEEEPCSIAAAQVARARRKMGGSFKLIFFSWENIAQRWYKLPNPRALVYPWCERLVFSQSAGAVAGGLEATRVLRGHGYRGPIGVIPQFGVDTDVFSRRDSSALREQLDLRNFVIGYIGRLLPEKGLGTLIDAAARLSIPFDLLIIGRGPEKKRLIRQARDLGLSHRMRLVDAVPHDSVPSHMNCMDVLVLPSITTRMWKEQFGRVLIEAMACEVPVIGSSSGEIPSVIGPAGALFNEGDPADLAARISEVFAGDRAAIGKRARRRVLENYTMHAVAEELREFILTVCASPSTPQHSLAGRPAGREDSNALP